MSNVMFQVLHRRRIKTMAGACNVLDHNLRNKILKSDLEQSESEEISIPNYLDVNFMKYNKHTGCLSREELCHEYQQKIDEAKLERKIQRNASRVIETVISSSHSFCEDWKTNENSMNKMQQYLEDSVAWETKRNGDVVLSVSYHWDETTPHVHILSIPLVPCIDKVTNKEKVKFSASEFFGGRGDLIRMHSDFYETVGRNYGLERGRNGSRTSHKDLKDYKGWEQEQREMILEKEKLLMGQEQEILVLQNENLHNAKFLSQREQELKKREHRIGFDENEVKAKQHDFELLIKKSKKNIPQIPEPPISLSRNKLQEWTDSVQTTVSNSFQNIKSAYSILVQKYNKMLSELQKIRSANKELYDENVLIKNILLNKPLSEIQADREDFAQRKKEQELKVKARNKDRGGYSR